MTEEISQVNFNQKYNKINSENLSKAAKTKIFGRFFRKRPKFSESVRTHPNAPRRIRMHPNVSEQVQAGPSTSENFKKLARTSKNFAKTSKMFAKLAKFLPSPVLLIRGLIPNSGSRIKEGFRVL